MTVKEKTFCVCCQSYEINLAYEFEKLKEQENVEDTLTSGICYDCEGLFHFKEDK
ncbi:hypothetical protein AM2_026 [Lactococcus phage AM2]|uniref:Uncharacterized protein n=8 Tax=Audreyjarvisvirus TaxID=2843351 RepID=A0A1W6JLE3_9CAUD|nr:hypothetical protein H1Z30_gp026 [Lactococcus phage AM1]YP_009905176.1 hypothetical protein H1Z34_gp029 [Lactococcus phage LW81]ARM66331.1 hypothetical protein AM2_026 [Lactococcus phage AM2]ARM66508.1 hypothetical protein AM3_026 [Lactococcus phage AM3]ARM67061.1 hypothetical protein AM8_026 [Lactococcus phage AM8]ARM67239.1 hypothetical protein AM9_026 [Lactococcus phage AM9]ARM67418.1 hypothetical protein AM11_026 [Lactococcus phage AM11]ARQ95606.1 hypothetical protein AM12_027 [Lactoc